MPLRRTALFPATSGYAGSIRPRSEVALSFLLRKPVDAAGFDFEGAGRAVALANVCAEIELAAPKTKAHERNCEMTLRNVFISQRVTESLALAKLSIQNHKGLLKVYLGIRFPSARDR